MHLPRIALVTLALVASCSSGHSSLEPTMDGAATDTQQESASAGDDLVCRCPESAAIMTSSIATNVSADTCTVSQNGAGANYSAKTTTGEPCIATFTFADGGTATANLTFTPLDGCCGGYLLKFSGISWQ